MAGRKQTKGTKGIFKSRKPGTAKALRCQHWAVSSPKAPQIAQLGRGRAPPPGLGAPVRERVP